MDKKIKYLGSWFDPVKNIKDNAFELKGKYDRKELKFNHYCNKKKRFEFLRQFNNEYNCDAKFKHFWPNMLDNGYRFCPLEFKGLKNRHGAKKGVKNCYKDRTEDIHWGCPLLGGRKSKKSKKCKSKKSKTIKRKH